MFAVPAHKRSQHQVFVENGNAAFRHGQEVAKAHGFSNTDPASIVAIRLGYDAGHELDMFVDGYRTKMAS